MKKLKYSRSVATNMVISNMIGTGIFTAIGFQVLPGAIPDPFSILLIWFLGGLCSLCGAFAYIEIATSIKRSGGEYAFLSELYHPLLGFIAGWISLIVGFAAAIASLSIATGEYILPFLGLSKDYFFTLFSIDISISKLLAFAIVLCVAIVHLKGVSSGSIFQNIFTSFKLFFIFILLIIPFIFPYYEPAGISFAPSEISYDTILSLSFAGSFVWVMFSYSGWNASTYIVMNLDQPKKNLPFSLIKGTVLVTIIYILLNMTFMYVATFDELAGEIDVGNIVTQKLLGSRGSVLFSGFFSIALISGISAMFIAGPRVLEEMGKDYRFLKKFSNIGKGGTPVKAIVLQTIVSLLLILFVSFKDLIEYIGITLSLCSMLTVLGVFIARKRKYSHQDIIKAWGYPFTPLVFIAFSIWMLTYFIQEDPYKILWTFLTILPAILIYYFYKKSN
jgi:APA family basic amino acid/polyamine antiporter